MQSVKKANILPILLTPMFLLCGCSTGQNPAKITDRPGSIEERLALQQQVAKRFQESAPQSPTAVDSAIELSEKYARLSEGAVLLQQQNEDFVVRNQQLKEQGIALEAQLKQTQKELTEANDLLIEMRIELNNWKTDILGFRDEMRDAETAQLEALLKILTVLGGQIASESAKSEVSGEVGSAVASLSKPDRP